MGSQDNVTDIKHTADSQDHINDKIQWVVKIMKQM